MKEITEDYCDFETAKLLKAKGFNEKCLRAYFNDGIISRIFDDKDEIYNENLLPSVVAAPTLQMAMKWLREKHKLFIDITAAMEDYIEDGVVKYKDPYYTWEVFSLEIGETLYFGGTPNVKESYEEACESAIKYCLENLI